MLLYLSICLAAGVASAQAGPPFTRVSPPPPDRDPQRREQIREVLKPARNAGSGAQVPTTDSVVLAPPSQYQLTPQGRAELREQLRREQIQNRGPQP